jgi:hypothetical protein
MTPLGWIGASVLAFAAFAVTLYFQKRNGKPFDGGGAGDFSSGHHSGGDFGGGDGGGGDS